MSNDAAGLLCNRDLNVAIKERTFWEVSRGVDRIVGTWVTWGTWRLVYHTLDAVIRAVDENLKSNVDGTMSAIVEESVPTDWNTWIDGP